MLWLLSELVALAALVPLDVLPNPPSPSATRAVYPEQGQGFAAYIIGGFLGLGVLILAMVLMSTRPRRASPRDLDR